MKADKDGFLVGEKLADEMRGLGRVIVEHGKEIATPAVAKVMDADPSIRAIGEVAGPLARMAGGVSAKAFAAMWLWMRREKRIDRKLEKAQLDALEDIGKSGPAVGAQTGQRGRGILGALSGMGSGAAALGGAILGRLGLKGLGKGAGSLLRRIPGVAGVLAVLKAGFDFSDAKTRGEKFQAVGGGVGAAGLGAIGGMLGGPIGAVAGVMIGDKVGKFLGGALDTHLPVLQAKWVEFTDRLGGSLTWLKDEAKSLLGDIKAKVEQGYEGVKESVGNTIGPVIDAAKEKGQSIIDRVTRGFSFLKGELFGHETKSDLPPVEGKSGVGDIIKSLTDTTIGRQIGKAVRAGMNMANWVLGKTSEKFETGGRGVGTVSHGRGDHGGVSYGSYQLATNTGTAAAYIKQSRYAQEFAGLKPGTPEFTAKWKAIAAREPDAFKADQHKFIERTHYAPVVRALKQQGLDIEHASPALRDAAWSTAVQFGPGLAATMIGRARTGAKSDIDIVRNLQQYKIDNNDRLFRSSNATNRAGTLARAKAELASLEKLHVAASQPTAIAVPKVAAVDAAPSVPNRISTSTTVNVHGGKQQDVGQAPGNAKVARIVTGGLS